MTHRSHHDSTRPEADCSPNATRRALVRSIGVGAAVLGGAPALSVGAAGQLEPREDVDTRVHGVEDWSLTTEEIDESAVQDGPTVTFEDDEVVVTGSYLFPRTGCETFAARRVVYAEDVSRLGVVVDAALTYDPAVAYVQCPDALMPLRYELRVTPEAHTREVVVEEAFTDDGQSFHPRTGLSEPEPLPTEVEAYDLTVGESAAPDDADPLTPEAAASIEPTVRFDGDDVIVEGAMTYGSSSCDEIGLTTVRRQHDVARHVGVRLTARRRRSWMPGDGCTDDVAADWYRLELTGSGDPAIDRCTVRENPTDAHHTLTVERTDRDLELPEGVLDHRLEIEPGAPYDDAGSDPTVHTETGDATDTVVVEGTAVTGSSSCSTLAVDEVSWQNDGSDDSQLLVRVASAERDHDFPGCTDDVVTVDYRLELAVDDLPDVVTAEESDGYADDPERSVTVELEGDDGLELPDGVLDYEFAIDQDADEADVEADPTVSTAETAAGPAVTVDGAMLVSGCHELAVTDVRWVDEGHLAVAVDAVGSADFQGSFGDCPLEVLPVPTGYTLQVVLESLPDVVTAEEPHAASREPPRSVTVELGDSGRCGGDAAAVEELETGDVVCDVDGDGDYRDVTGDGSVTNSDVTEFFANQHAPPWDDRVDLFDFTGDGEVTQADVIELFSSVS